MRLPSLILLLALLFAPQTATAAEPPLVRVRLETSAGPIVVALDTRRAPKTAANFLAYVDDGRFEGTRFYRAARRGEKGGRGFIQGGVGTDARRSLPPVTLEPTSQTGIRHLDATVSMARGERADSGSGNFFITAGPMPNMDARGAYAGYAAFGHVVDGMGVVRRILAQPTAGGSGPMKDQMLVEPVTIERAVRLDGEAKPTGQPKPWLLPRRAPPAASTAPDPTPVPAPSPTVTALTRSPPMFPALPTELLLLGLSTVLLFAHVMIQAQTATRERGLQWNAGARDGGAPALGVVAGRAARALANFQETYPAFIALALALAVSGRTGALGATGAWLWFGARVAYVPLYLAGVAYVRSIAWGLSLVGLGLMLWRLLFG